MDDKSMQVWTTFELTSPPGHPTLVRVGRPQKPQSPGAYRKAFFERVRTARKTITDEPRVMAERLGVPYGTYVRYETRTMLPHHLIPRFCQITDFTPDWLFNGPEPGKPSRLSAEQKPQPAT